MLDFLFVKVDKDYTRVSYSDIIYIEGLKNYMQIALEAKEQQKEYPFIVFDKSTNEYAGSTRFYDIQQSYLSAQLGFTWYGKKFQQTGLNRHCKLLILSFAFEEWELERVEFRAHAANERSIKAMKAIGCTEEGILRSHMPTVDGSRRDSVVLSILKSEWEAGIKEMLKTKTH